MHSLALLMALPSTHLNQEFLNHPRIFSHSQHQAPQSANFTSHVFLKFVISSSSFFLCLNASPCHFLLRSEFLRKVLLPTMPCQVSHTKWSFSKCLNKWISSNHLYHNKWYHTLEWYRLPRGLPWFHFIPQSTRLIHGNAIAATCKISPASTHSSILPLTQS